MSLMPTYSRLPVTFVRGEGVHVWDRNGKRYLDALAGIAVCGLGHANPAVAAAISTQAGELLHTSNLYGIEKQQALADALVSLSGMEVVFFCNSGAEANEAAIKIARAHGHSKGIEKPEIIVTDHSFHGRTLATLSATGNAKVHSGFEPLVEGFVRVPFDDLAAAERAAKDHSGVIAVLVEPIQGEGGVVVPDPSYLSGLRSLCDRRGLLLMLDEVQTGMGRTGAWFTHQHYGISADVMTLAKALGNGVPIGACLARSEAAAALKPGSHGSTFGGNPLACAAALAVIATIQREHLVERAAEAGARLAAGLKRALSGQNCVVEVRGRGLMIGIELDRPCAELVGMALERGLLINVTAERVVRLLPPLIISNEQIDEVAGTLGSLIRTWNAGGAAAE
ncbi:MAG: acetylornithine transaminase [Gammaproteobacteria bacterium]|nr:acetylornithine transaminase [Gammaproteobacteria bacterium]MDH3390032.1 acetylornithine transaminase [Gammaproteobacteria bacterium]